MTGQRLAFASLFLGIIAACDSPLPWSASNDASSNHQGVPSIPNTLTSTAAESDAVEVEVEVGAASEPLRRLGEQRLTRTDFDAMRLLASTSQGALQAYTDWAEGLKLMAEDFPIYEHILDDDVPAEAQLKRQLRGIYLALESRAAELRKYKNDRAALDEFKRWRRSMEQQLADRGAQQAVLEKRLEKLSEVPSPPHIDEKAPKAAEEELVVATPPNEPDRSEPPQPMQLASRHVVFIALATPQHSRAQLVIRPHADASPIALKEGDAFDWFGQRFTLERIYRRTAKHLSVDFIHNGKRTTVDYRGSRASLEDA